MSRNDAMSIINDVPPKIPPSPVKFMDQLRAAIRAHNLAYKTEKTYCLLITYKRHQF